MDYNAYRSDHILILELPSLRSVLRRVILQLDRHQRLLAAC